MKMKTDWIKLFIFFGSISNVLGNETEYAKTGGDRFVHRKAALARDIEQDLSADRIKRQVVDGQFTDDKPTTDAQADSSGELPTASTNPDIFVTETNDVSTGTSDVTDPDLGLNGTTTAFTAWWDKVDVETTPCNAETNEGCDTSQFERCSKDGVCRCLNGFALSRDYSQCVAARYFRGEIRLFLDLTQWLNGSEPEEGENMLKAEFRNAILTVFSAESMASILDVRVVEIEERSGVIVRFEIVLDRTKAPRREGLQDTYRYSVLSNLVPNPAGSYVIRGTSLVIAPVRSNVTDIITSLSLSDFNHCLDTGHNYCDHNAVCTNRMGTFVCRCRVGYTDTSPDLRSTPGERCTPTCGCQNNGTCLVTDKSVSCRCPQWFLGEKCEIDGKMLLIVLCSVLGGLLLITMVFCLICVCAFKKKARKAKRSTAATISSIDSTLIKLPRPWMDTSRSYEAPPRDLRRWSYVSEPIRYADELMMDDHYHSETLPLPHSYDQTRRQMASYQVRYPHQEPGVPQRNSSGQAILPYGQVQNVGSLYYT